MTTKRSIGFLISYFLFLILLAACRPVDAPSLEPDPDNKSPAAVAIHNPAPAPSATPATPLNLVVLHTNDTWGYYDPCG